MFRFVNHWWEYVSAEFSTSRRTRPSSTSNSQLHVETLEARLNLSGSVGEGFYDFENLAVDTRAPDPIVYNPNSSAADTSETVDFRFNLLPFVNPQGQTRNPINDTPRVFNPSGINVGGKMLRFSSRAVEIPNGDPRIFDGSITFDTEVHFVEFKIRSAGNLDDIGISLPNSSASIVISDLNEGNFNTKLVRIGNRLSGSGFDDIQFNFANGQIDSPDVPKIHLDEFCVFRRPVASFAFSNSVTSEGAPVTATATLSNPVAFPISVNMAYGGTGITGGDVSFPSTLSIAATQKSGSITRTVAADNTVELDELVTGAMISGGGFLLGSNIDDSFVIPNDDLANANVTVLTPNVNEGVAAQVRIDLTNPVDVPVTINLDYLDGTATKSLDYADNPQSVTISANSTSSSVFTVQTFEDQVSESTENFTIRVGSINANGRSASPGTSGVVNILDVAPSLPLLSLSDAGSVAEGGNATFTASLDQVAATQVNFTVRYVDESATDGDPVSPDDYSSGGTMYSIGVGQSSVQIPVPTIDDDIYENTEGFRVEIISVEEAVLDDAIGVGTILDNDSAPVVSIENEDIIVDEGDDAIVAILLSHPTEVPGSVTLTTSDGSATDPEDYDGVDTVITFGSDPDSDSAAALRKEVTITTNADSANEGDENFFFQIDSPVESTLFSTPLDGEVTIQGPAGIDFGDAPAIYGTLLADNGPRHQIGDLYFGSAPDGEADGLSSSDARGDNRDGRWDEDGITFLSPAIAGQPLLIQVNVTGNEGRVAGWIDVDGSFTFDNDERIFRVLPEGTHQLTFDIPADAQIGETFARFRIAETAAESAVPLGAASNGEVEDYQLEILSAAPELFDFGDAPAAYGTLLADNGPRHRPGDLFFGSFSDVEFDGLPDSNAQADDALNQDDDDGIVFSSAAIPGQTLEFAVTVSKPDVRFAGWFDFDQSFSFDNHERVFRVLPTAGTHFITVDVPADAPLGTTFARFRVAETAAESGVPKGVANNGEVEDFQILVTDTELPRFDFGDAPESYKTSIRTGGPQHIAGDLFLGSAIDTELDGFANADALGDDFLTQDDEDGVVFTSAAIPGQTLEFAVTSSRADGRLGGWFDFDQSGTFDNGERFFRVLPTAGTHFLSVEVPVDAVLGDTFARFRIADTAAESGVVGGLASNGEVEDYKISVTDTAPPEFDFGDAPESYGTSLLSNGPRHAAGDLFFGGSFDTEIDGFPSGDAQGDDQLGADDEDGITFTSTPVPGGTLDFEVTVSRAGGRFAGWFDFDQSGTFEIDERFFRVLSTAGSHQFSVDVPADALLGSTYARFRIADTAAESGVVGGFASNGEVEDYQFEIVATPPLFSNLNGSLAGSNRGALMAQTELNAAWVPRSAQFEKAAVTVNDDVAVSDLDTLSVIAFDESVTTDESEPSRTRMPFEMVAFDLETQQLTEVDLMVELDAVSE